MKAPFFSLILMVREGPFCSSHLRWEDRPWLESDQMHYSKLLFEKTSEFVLSVTISHQRPLHGRSHAQPNEASSLKTLFKLHFGRSLRTVASLMRILNCCKLSSEGRLAFWKQSEVIWSQVESQKGTRNKMHLYPGQLVFLWAILGFWGNLGKKVPDQFWTRPVGGLVRISLRPLGSCFEKNSIYFIVYSCVVNNVLIPLLYNNILDASSYKEDLPLAYWLLPFKKPNRQTTAFK